MKNKYIILFLLLISFNINNSLFGQEFNFETSTINILNKGNIIIAQNGSIFFKKKNLRIKAQNFKYNKNKQTLTILKGIAEFSKNNLSIYADEFYYDEVTSFLRAKGNVKIKDGLNNVSIHSENIFYDINKEIIKSEFPTVINNYLNSKIQIKSFIYMVNDNLIKLNSVNIVDNDKNIYNLDKAFLNLNSKKLIGKDVSIDFNNINLGSNNNPRLKSNSINIGDENVILKKGVFTTCQKNDKCPPWQLSASEIKHNKTKKTIYYKDAFLKIYDVPVFYFPKFFHPDPSVKRQSGFLVPKFQDSSSLGMSLNLPYFYALSDNKDFTFNPRLYSNNKYLAQAEFRQINKNSSHTIDSSFLNDNKISKSHFFYQGSKKLNLDNFDDSNLTVKVENVSNDTYLKTYKLTSPLINNESLLNSSINIDLYRQDLKFSAAIEAYEDLNKEKSDRYEFILPSFDLVKELKNNTNLDGRFSFLSNGSIKNFDTNVNEKIFINDLLFNSETFLSSKGIANEYNFLIKNVTTDSDNSTLYKNNFDTTISSLFEYKSSYPMIKETEEYKNILKPQTSIRLGTNQVINQKDIDQRSNIEDIYSLYRSGSNTSLEEGLSLTYGAVFEKSKKLNLDTNVLTIEMANVLRLEENDKSSRNSGLDEKISDIFGKIEYKPIDLVEINYDFSIKNNFKQQNYEYLSAKFKVNNFLTNFNYLNEDNTFSKESYIANTSTYYIDDSNNLSFKTRKNKKTKITEFYNLIYQYKNDCLAAAIEYKKDYYSDRDLQPEESLFLTLTIIPFGSSNTPNFKP
jgi:LPS-assembly protein